MTGLSGSSRCRPISEEELRELLAGPRFSDVDADELLGPATG